jgi:hypothetical protein
VVLELLVQIQQEWSNSLGESKQPLASLVGLVAKNLVPAQQLVVATLPMGKLEQ